MDKWTIEKKSGEVFSELSSIEVRDGLRTGDYDLYDLISRSDSPLTRKILEVDQVFAHIHAKPGQEQDSVYRSKAIGDKSKPRFEDLGVTQVRQPEQNLKVAKRKHEVRARRGQEKRHYMIFNKKGRKWGPFSPAEISAMYFRGNIEPRSFIKKFGSRKKQRVERFVAAYAQASSVDFVPTQQSHIIRKRVEKLGSPLQAWVTIFISVTIIAGVFLWSSPHKQQQLKTYLIEAKEVVDDKLGEEEFVKPEAPKLSKKASEPSEPSARSKEPSARSKSTRSKIHKQNNKLKYHQQNQRPRRSRNVNKNFTSNRAAQRSNAKSHFPYDKSIGKIITVPGASWNKADVNSCQSKCLLRIRDRSGQSLKIAFFKQHFNDMFKSLGSKVTVTGKLDRVSDEFIIYLQSIR